MLKLQLAVGGASLVAAAAAAAFAMRRRLPLQKRAMLVARRL